MAIPFVSLFRVKDDLQADAALLSLGDLYLVSTSNAHQHILLFYFPGSGFIMCSGKENPDSDADLDVDGDDTLEYGKPQYRFWKAYNWEGTSRSIFS